MRIVIAIAGLAWFSLTSAGLPAQDVFDLPVRINMGGPQTVDALGRTWLGDGAGDPLNIRPDDNGGRNVIGAWCNAPAEPLELGYDLVDGTAATLPQSSEMFRSIRYGGLGLFDLAIPIPNGEYLVNTYFCEACCLNRHQFTSIEGEVVEADVHAGMYAGGLQSVGRLGYVVTVEDDVLDIHLEGCFDPDCPGGADGNAIISALEIVPTGYLVCDEPGVGQCPTDLTCAADSVAGTVTLSWSNPPCGLTIEEYEIFRNGESIATLDVTETSYVDEPTDRLNDYALVPVSDGKSGCASLTCFAVVESLPFEIPLRINMGGPATVDELGREWLSDRGPGQDRLRIRPDDNGGVNTAENWCPGSGDPVDLGYDNGDGVQAFLPSNSKQFRDIRWDPGLDAFPFVIEIPVPNGTYNLSLFFCELGGDPLARRFSVAVQGEVISADTSAESYAGASQQTGRIGLEGVVVDGGEGSEQGILRIDLLGCPDPDCPGAIDVNPIINAIELVPSDFSVCDDPGVGQCPSGLSCVLDAKSGVVSGTWTGPVCPAALAGYELLRNGQSIGTLGAEETTFTDEPTTRFSLYELVPQFDNEDADACATLRCEVVASSLPFSLPLRLNMGGDTTVDSRGEVWIGDRPCALAQNADPLDIRPDDAGGSNSICNWCAPIPETIAAFGYDGNDPGDRHIFSTIRWDIGADPIIYQLDLPFPEGGEYDVSMFFTECCCDFRHFKIEIQGEIVNSDVSFEDYNPDNPVLLGSGVLRFTGIQVCPDGLLTIRLLPCSDPECPGGTDNNAILSALAIDRVGDGEPNNAPNAVASADPSTAILSDNVAVVTLDGSASDDGDGGVQGLTYLWTQIEPPNPPLGGNVIETPNEATTQVEIRRGAGTYRFRLDIDDGQPCGSSASVEVELTVTEGVLFVRGDSDSSGTVELTDGVVTLSFLFLGATPPVCLDAADTDDNGAVELTDAVITFGWLFLGGPAPQPPSPSDGTYPAEDCGIDPTDEDALECESSAETCS